MSENEQKRMGSSILYGEDEAKLGRHHCQVRDVMIDVEFRAMVFFLKINMNSLYYDSNMR